MAKRVLVISASPRKGANSGILSDAFIEGAQAAGHTTKKVLLREKTVCYCIGCEACIRNGGNCVQKDDAAGILEDMVAADVIVLATPVYFYTMDAQLKTLIDRSVAKYTHINNKDFYFIATAADTREKSLEPTFEGLRAFLSCLNGAEEKGAVYGAGVYAAGDIKQTPAMEEARHMGRLS